MTNVTLTGGSYLDSWTGHTRTAASGFTATVANTFIYLAISLVSTNNTPANVTSVTDSLGLTWTRQTHTSQIGITSGITSGPVAQQLEVWTAPVSGTPSWTGHTLTIVSDTNTDTGVAFGATIQNVLFAGPFDLNTIVHPSAHAERTTASTSTTMSMTGLSNDTANCCYICIRAAAGAGNNINSGTFHIAGGSFDFGNGTLINGTNFNIMSTQGKAFTSAQSNITIDSASTTANGMMLAIVLTADAQLVGPHGTWASTEVTDTFAAAGYPGGFGIIGDLTSTEARDIFAAVGYPNNAGVWTTLEAPDRFSAFGFQPQTAVWHSTEATDIFSATGIGRGENGVWASTEAPDIFAATGFTRVSGTFIVTEAADRFQAFGAGVIRVRRRRTSFVT